MRNLRNNYPYPNMLHRTESDFSIYNTNENRLNAYNLYSAYNPYPFQRSTDEFFNTSPYYNDNYLSTYGNFDNYNYDYYYSLNRPYSRDYSNIDDIYKRYNYSCDLHKSPIQPNRTINPKKDDLYNNYFLDKYKTNINGDYSYSNTLNRDYYKSLSEDYNINIYNKNNNSYNDSNNINKNDNLDISRDYLNELKRKIDDYYKYENLLKDGYDYEKYKNDIYDLLKYDDLDLIKKKNDYYNDYLKDNKSKTSYTNTINDKNYFKSNYTNYATL